MGSRRHRGGVGDLLATHRDGRRWLIECKTTTRGPFADYGPTKRKEAIDHGEKHDLSVWLVWRAPRQATQWFPALLWPKERERTA